MMSHIDAIHAKIVYNSLRSIRAGRKKSGAVRKRNARLRRIEKEIDQEWAKRERAQ